MATSGEMLAAGREIAAVTSAFWVCRHCQPPGSGQAEAKMELDVQAGLDMEVGSWQAAWF